MPHLSLYLLGPPRLERDGEAVPIHRRKTMALLAYLAVTDRSHQREALAALLWPEWDASSARADLRRTLSLVNRALSGDAIVADRETAGLDPDLGLRLDVAAFRQALAACEAASHAPGEACAECVPGLEEAVALYGDGFLAGFTLEDSAAFDEWQFFETQALQDAATDALRRLVTWHAGEAARDYDQAIAYARQWLALDPLHEPAHRQLMALYTEAGQRSAALRQYRECLRVLEEELGVTPSAATTSLYEQVRARRPTPRDAEPTAPLEPQLPDYLEEGQQPKVAASVFVGRETELARLEGYLEAAIEGQGQVAFVVGGAGRGKTTLLRAFAEQAMASHSDLLVVSGACNAFSGVGDAYLPFREALGMLTGDVERRWTAGTVSTDHARRLWLALPVTLPALVEHGPHVINGLVSGKQLIARATEAGLDGAPWVPELRSLSGRTAGGGLEQAALFHQVTNVLQAAASAQPLLLLLDDLQWADQGTMGLLVHLGRRLAGSRILILGAYRPEEVPAAPAVSTKALQELRRQYGEVWIDLREADVVGGERFVNAFLDAEPNRLGDDFRSALYARTRGHALFTVELLRSLRESGDLRQDATGAWIAAPEMDWGALPARVTAVIEGRLDRLDHELRDLLAVASVEGETFTVDVLAEVQGLGQRATLRHLSELAKRDRLVAEAEAVRSDGTTLVRYAFSHALFQAYLYEELSEGERRLLHGDSDEALEDLYATESDAIAPQLAHHYAQAEDRPKAVEWAVKAGDRARAAYANTEAIGWYERVLAMTAEPDDSTASLIWRLQALSGLGKVCYHTGEYRGG